MSRWTLIVLCMVLPSATLARDLPDPELTPGVVTALTSAEVCGIRWGRDARKVTAAMRRMVFEGYGLSGNRDRSCKGKRHFEVDHLISRELGGADDVLNLWPQCYSGRWNASIKDRLENRLHREVCAGTITLEDAQAAIRDDWRVPYRNYFGEPR